MKIKKNIALSETGFVFNPTNGDSFSVNPIGLEILKKLKDNVSPEEIKAFLLETYTTDADSVENDYYDFVKTIEQLQLSETDGPKKD